MYNDNIDSAKVSEKNMVFAVTGITGHTGRFFLRELEIHDFKGTVRCLVRDTSNTLLLDASPLHIEKVIGDVNNYSNLLTLTDQVDVIVHIYNIHNSVDMLNAAIENRVPRIVMVHTTGVYSKFKMASGEYKEIETEVEGILHHHSVIDCTILRPTMIFGDMCDRNISKFIKMVDKFPFMPEINHGRGRIQPVNVRDLAKACYQATYATHLPETYYDVSGEKSLSIHELCAAIGKGMGKHVRFISCPMWFGVLGARCLKIVSLGKVDFVEKVFRMAENRDYGHDAATSDFGYKPEKFDVGIKREVNEYLHLKRGKAKF